MWSRITSHATFMHDDSEQKLWMSTVQCPCLSARGGCCRHQEWEEADVGFWRPTNLVLLYFSDLLLKCGPCVLVLYSGANPIPFSDILFFHSELRVRLKERKKERRMGVEIEWMSFISRWDIISSKNSKKDNWRKMEGIHYRDPWECFLYFSPCIILIMKERKHIEKTYKPPFLWRNQ